MLTDLEKEMLEVMEKAFDILDDIPVPPWNEEICGVETVNSSIQEAHDLLDDNIMKIRRRLGG